MNTPATLSPVWHPKGEHVEFKDLERQCGFLEPFLQEVMCFSHLACLLQPHHSRPSSHHLLLLSTLTSFSLSPGPSMVSLLAKTNFTSFFSQITSPFSLLSSHSKHSLPRTSLVLQWLRRQDPSAGAWVQSLVRELDSTTKSLNVTTKDSACCN